MNRVPHWLWPKTKRVETTPLIRIGRALHWACAMLAGLLLLIACLITVAVASAQKTESYNQADEATRQAIKNGRAIREEFRREQPELRTTEPPNPFDRSDKRVPKTTSPEHFLTDEQVGTHWKPVSGGLPASTIGDKLPHQTDRRGKPEPTPYGQGKADAASDTPQPTASPPPGSPDCRDLPDGAQTFDDFTGRCPALEAARKRDARRGHDFEQLLKVLLAAAALLMLGRGLRYVLANE